MSQLGRIGGLLGLFRPLRLNMGPLVLCCSAVLASRADLFSLFTPLSAKSLCPAQTVLSPVMRCTNRSWDSTGGFVQYPSGNLCINYSAASGSGTLFGPAGDTLLKWKDDDRDSGVSPYVDMALDQ